MESIDTITKKVIELTKNQHFGIISSLDKLNKIESNLISFAMSEDLKSLIFYTPKTSKKYNRIVGNDNVCIYINNTINEGRDISKALGISVSANYNAKPQNLAELSLLYSRKLPFMMGFVNSQSFTPIVVSIDTIEVTLRFQEVVVLKI